MRRLTVLLATAAAALAVAPAAQGIVLPALTTYPVSIDVYLTVTEEVRWAGITDGCFAPDENLELSYELALDSLPTQQAKIRNGTATLTSQSYGVTPSVGDKGSFRQRGKPGPWELRLQNPADCNTPAKPVPGTIKSPRCNTISERIIATLTADDDVSGDGSLVLTRSPTTRPVLKGKAIDPSCYRGLMSVTPVGKDAALGIDPASTVLQFPIRRLRAQLTLLGRGSDKARPSFTTRLSLSGPCNAMQSTPSAGPRDNFQLQYWRPHEVLGGPDLEDTSKVSCRIGGIGRVKVRRTGPVVDVLKIPKIPQIPKIPGT